MRARTSESRMDQEVAVWQLFEQGVGDSRTLVRHCRSCRPNTKSFRNPWRRPPSRLRLSNIHDADSAPVLARGLSTIGQDGARSCRGTPHRTQIALDLSLREKDRFQQPTQLVTKCQFRPAGKPLVARKSGATHCGPYRRPKTRDNHGS